MHDGMKHEAEGRRAALADLKGLGKRVMSNRLRGAVAKPAAAVSEAAPAQEGPSLMDRLRRLKGK